MVRAASSATRTDTSAMRLLVSITCCRPSRTRSLCTRHEVLHRAGARKPVHGVDVLLQAVLDEVDHLLRDLLSAARQHGAGLRHGLEVLGRAPRQLLGLRAVEAQHLRELIRYTLEGLAGGVQAR